MIKALREHPRLHVDRRLPNPEKMYLKNEENRYTRPLVDVRGSDLSNKDLSAYNALMDFTFDQFTIFPTNHSKWPQHLDVKNFLELGKDPGLGIRKLHEKGIDGTGISMAIIDQPLSDHQEYRDNLVHYEEIGYENTPRIFGSMHGSAVASIAVGKTVGVAPKAKLYYFAAPNMHRKSDETMELYSGYRAKALERIIELNKTLPPDKKIQVVSISWMGMNKCSGKEKWNTALANAKKAGLFVLSCAPWQDYKLNFMGMGREALADPNSVESYGPASWGKELKNEEEAKQNPDVLSRFEKTLLVPMDGRTTADPQSNSSYVFYGHGGLSWATPWAASMFLLARQARPNITPEDFWKCALNTGKFNLKAGGVIINPPALIDTIHTRQDRSKGVPLPLLVGSPFCK